VDPGGNAQSIISTLKRTTPNLVPDIYLTHGHFDHISAVPKLCEAFPTARLFSSEIEREFLVNPHLNLSSTVGQPIDLTKFLSKVTWISDGQNLRFGDVEFKVLALPGHTPGSTGLYSLSEKCVFVGDTLFAGSVGNPDFPGGNFQTLMKSIFAKLLTLPDETVVYPGHGDVTTIQEERANNPYIQELLK
jgi:hydroxyacylglutathione hydrolase